MLNKNTQMDEELDHAVHQKVIREMKLALWFLGVSTAMLVAIKFLWSNE